MHEVEHFHNKRALAYRLSWEKQFEDEFLEAGGSLLALVLREQAIVSEQPWDTYPEQLREEAQATLMSPLHHQMLMALQFSTEPDKAQHVEDFLNFWKTVTARKWLAWLQILKIFGHIDEQNWLIALGIYKRHDKMVLVGGKVEVLFERMNNNQISIKKIHED